MRKAISALLGLTGLVCVFSGCSKPQTHDAPVAETDTTLPEAHVDTASAATISGNVLFRGVRPVMPTIDFSSNPQCEREHKRPVSAETVVVNANGTLANTLVWVSSGLPPGRWPAPSALARMDQAGCIYKPHVLALMVGQDLEVLNSDSVNHNVHAEAALNPATNDMEPPRAESIHKRYTKQEVWFPLTCSVHPWMRAYVAVIAHPFFAVTGSDGSFSISGVPPGTYTLEAVHEKYGRKTLQVQLAVRGNEKVDFEYGE